ncbi:MAG: DUF4349 domain-containing protein [Algicola sp.]|nr:DUF4349 domain-containing protein [Algicola sp.]
MKLLFTILSITLLPLACSNNSSSNDAYKYESPAVVEALDMDGGAPQQSEHLPTASVEQKLIKEAFLEFETKNLDQTFGKIASTVKKYKGYIQDDTSNKLYNRLSRRLTVRIPTTAFQAVLDTISHDVAYFDTKQISAKDVTEEFIDLEARLKAKRELETRYLELLAKAKTVKEILEIERELSNIREAIEAKQGRLNYLQSKVALSTLTIEFYKTTAQESGATISYAQKMWKAIKSGFNGISLFFLGILHIWPFILILILSFFVVKRWLKKRHKKI